MIDLEANPGAVCDPFELDLFVCEILQFEKVNSGKISFINIGGSFRRVTPRKTIFMDSSCFPQRVAMTEVQIHQISIVKTKP